MSAIKIKGNEEKLSEMSGTDIGAKKKEYEKIFEIKLNYNLRSVPKNELISLLKTVLPPSGEHLYTKDVYLRSAYQFPARVNILGDGKSSIILCPELMEKEALTLRQNLEEYTDDTFAEEYAHLKVEELGWDGKIRKASENFEMTYLPQIEDCIIFQRIGGNLGELFADEIVIRYHDSENKILEDRKKNIERNLSAHGGKGHDKIDAWQNFAFITALPPSYRKNKINWQKDEDGLINHKGAFHKLIDGRIENEFYELKNHISSIKIPPNSLNTFYDKAFSTYLTVKEKLGEL